MYLSSTHKPCTIPEPLHNKHFISLSGR